jgi:hypothetical protein
MAQQAREILSKPDRVHIEAFVLALFKHATPGNWVSLRAFFEDRANRKPFKITPHKLNGNLDVLIDQAYRVAELAALAADKVVFCPPIASFTNPNHAREEDLAEGFVLNVDCDEHAQAARTKLEGLLGPATVVVASGGEWTDPSTGKVELKLHLDYRLKRPARSKEEQAKLKEARRLAAMIVGGDMSNAPSTHPIRWPGSVHRKGEPKLCRIVGFNPDAEINLGEALDILRKAAGNGRACHETSSGAAPFDGQKIAVAPAFKHLDPKQKLADGIPEAHLRPFTAIKAECGWLRHVHDTGGADQSEVQWRDSLRVSMFLVDGKTLVHQFSAKHPGYDFDATEKKFADALRYKEQDDLGWPLCQTICDHGATQCKACPHFNKGQSPLHLAWQQLPIPEIPGEKLPLIVELGTRLWGPATANGTEYRFGADQSKVIDPRRNIWFDFATNKGGSLRDLMRKVEVVCREQTNADDVVAVCAADVIVRALDWIWPGHLLRGAQELMSGLPDLCKSQVQICYIACITARLPWPDGARAIEPMNVIMLTAEDTVDQIVTPRLIAAGADISRVHILKFIKTDERDRQFLLSDDLYRLEHLVKKIGNVGLITLDPITAYMGGKTDSHKATEVRSQLGPLKDFAERLNVGVSTITHPPKKAGQRAIDHFIASQAFIAACRIGHLCIPEMEEGEEPRPTGRILFTTVRHSYSQPVPTLAYHKATVTVNDIVQAPRVVWEGEVNITADAAIAATSSKKPDQQMKVQAFLHEMLKDGNPVLQKEIEEAGYAKGFTEKQLRTAGERLGVHVFKEPGKMDGRWFWRLSNPDEGRYHY